uniref:Protein TsetseEP domain-containing protein n=1 Tax=Glossina brevipalpis TaxID=37001 RepID=A0A1A9WY57_9MUSC
MKIVLILLLNLFIIHQSCAYKEILSILENERDLQTDERNALYPLFQEMQLQYDFIVQEMSQDIDKETEPSQQQQQVSAENKSAEDALKDFQRYFEKLTSGRNSISNIYDESQLPTLEDLLVNTTDLNELNREQQLEFQDVQNIMQDSLDRAQRNINQLIKKSLDIETILLQLNKPKILSLILKALSILFNVASKVSRAAYCTYSYTPELNVTLHYLHEGFHCYAYTTSLIEAVQHETITTIKTIKDNIFDVVSVFKRFAAQNSLVGKILTLVLSFNEIIRSIVDTYNTSVHALDAVQNQLPLAALEVNNCSKNFLIKIPYILQTVSNITECIMFVEDTVSDYPFMLPEENSE